MFFNVLLLVAAFARITSATVATCNTCLANIIPIDTVIDPINWTPGDTTTVGISVQWSGCTTDCYWQYNLIDGTTGYTASYAGTHNYPTASGTRLENFRTLGNTDQLPRSALIAGRRYTVRITGGSLGSGTQVNKDLAAFTVTHDASPASPSAGIVRRRRLEEARGVQVPIGFQCQQGSACYIKSAWQCMRTDVLLESCGGCPGQAETQDCSAIPNASIVNCEVGQCIVSECEYGYEVSSEGDSCVAA